MKQEKATNPTKEGKLTSEKRKVVNERVDKFLPIIVDNILGAGGKDEIRTPLWPLHTHRGLLYWGKEWSKDLYSVVNELDQKKLPNQEVAQLFKHSSRIAQCLWRLDAIKQSDLSKEAKLYTVGRLFDYLEAYRGRNLFCETGQNSIWTPKEIEKQIGRLTFINLTQAKDLKTLVSHLQGVLWSYTELIYWTNHPFGHSFHGPYKTSKGDLLVRSYFDLKPEIWPFTQKLDFSGMTFFELYERDTDLSLDFFERGIRTTKPYQEKLKAVAIKIGDQDITTKEELEKHLNNLVEVCEKGSAHINSLDDQAIITKHTEMWWYVLKPLFQTAGKDWHPSQVVHDNIYNRYEELEQIWKEKQQRPEPTSPEEARKNIRQAFDFR